MHFFEALIKFKLSSEKVNVVAQSISVGRTSGHVDQVKVSKLSTLNTLYNATVFVECMGYLDQRHYGSSEAESNSLKLTDLTKCA